MLVFVITLAAAVLCTLPFLLLSGAELGVTLRAFLNGSLGSPFAFAETLVQLIPLLIAGMAVAISFHGGLFNMGVEGQLISGGLVAGMIGAEVEAPPLVLAGLVLLGGVAGGALAAQVPGVFGRFFDAFSAGYGWDAIAVALLAALAPFALIVSAFFFAVLDSGAMQMQAVAGICREMVGVVSGLVVAFVALQPWLLHGLERLRSRRHSRREAAAPVIQTDSGDAK